MLDATKVVDSSVWARKHEADVPIFGPLHEIGRLSVVTVNLGDSTVAVRLSDGMAFYDQAVADFCMHGTYLPVRRAHPTTTSLARHPLRLFIRA